MNKRQKLEAFNAEICRAGGEAVRNGLTPVDLMHVLAASMAGLIHSLNGNDGDVAEAFWQLSRQFDAKHMASEQRTPMNGAATNADARAEARQ